MKQKFLAMFAAAVVLLGLTGCTAVDNPSTPDTSILEQSLIGLWWDEFEYADVTETGEPYSRVLLVVEVNADHTGCIYLAAFDDKSDEPLAVYGGPEDAGFNWRLLADGRVQLSDPVTGETYALTRGAGGSYGNDMTNVSNTSLAYNNGSVWLSNGSYSGTLAKADANKAADIGKKTQAGPVSLDLTSPAVGQVIGDDGKNYDYSSLPGGVTAIAKICYVDGAGKGLALALTDEGKMDSGKASSTAAAHKPALSNGKWKLATKSEWNNMINVGGYITLRDGFTSVGGTNLESDRYWSDTPHERYYDDVWCYSFDGIGFWDSDPWNISNYVRACLAF